MRIVTALAIYAASMALGGLAGHVIGRTFLMMYAIPLTIVAGVTIGLAASRCIHWYLGRSK